MREHLVHNRHSLLGVIEQFLASGCDLLLDFDARWILWTTCRREHLRWHIWALNGLNSALPHWLGRSLAHLAVVIVILLLRLRLLSELISLRADRGSCWGIIYRNLFVLLFNSLLPYYVLLRHFCLSLGLQLLLRLLHVLVRMRRSWRSYLLFWDLLLLLWRTDVISVSISLLRVKETF